MKLYRVVYPKRRPWHWRACCSVKASGPLRRAIDRGVCSPRLVETCEGLTREDERCAHCERMDRVDRERARLQQYIIAKDK